MISLHYCRFRAGYSQLNSEYIHMYGIVLTSAIAIVYTANCNQQENMQWYSGIA